MDDFAKAVGLPMLSLMQRALLVIRLPVLFVVVTNFQERTSEPESLSADNCGYRAVFVSLCV